MWMRPAKIGLMYGTQVPTIQYTLGWTTTIYAREDFYIIVFVEEKSLLFGNEKNKKFIASVVRYQLLC